MSKPLLLIVVLLLAAGASRPARADDTEAARGAYTEGSRLYDLGDYREALDAFRRAYLKLESPAFLYNIAQCHKQLGNRRDAIKFYRTYLQLAPGATDRAEVEAVIAELEAQIAAEPKPAAAVAPPAPAPAPAATVVVAAPAPPVERPIYKRWWLWTVVGVAVVGVGVGVGLGVGLSARGSGFDPTLPNLRLSSLVSY